MDARGRGTEWFWPDGPAKVRVPGAALDVLAQALAAAGNGALLVFRAWQYVLQWEDSAAAPTAGRPSRSSLQRAAGSRLQQARASIRWYKLSFVGRSGGTGGGDGYPTPPGPFVQIAALAGQEESGKAADAGTSTSDAVERLLSGAAETLDAFE